MEFTHNTINDNLPKHWPSQKKSTGDKTDKWGKACIDAAEQILLYADPAIRQSRKNKKINYNLYNDILNVKDIESSINPLGFNMNSFPATLRNYPIVNPKINRLGGEELKRLFDFKVTLSNDDAISDKERQQKEIVFNTLQELLTANLPKPDEAQSEEEAEKIGQMIQQKLAQTQKYINFEWQDKRELAATWILQHYYKQLDLKSTFNDGFYDALLAGEELYCVDAIAGEPVVRRCNPLNTYAFLAPDCKYWDEADIILEEGYRSIGSVIDDYHDYLSNADIDYLEKGYRSEGTDLGVPIFSASAYLSSMGEELPLSDDNPVSGEFGNFDNEGNVRVVRVVWKSRRKIGNLKYYDEEGQPQETMVDEYYKIDKSIGEEVEWLWINEYWEGTRIGADIYVKIQPRPIQFRQMTNPSKCKSGYVGTQYMTGVGKAMSMMDRMKPYQYLYNIFMYRTELAFAKNRGKIAELDVTKIPEGWDMDKWLYYAEVIGWAPVDPFKEGKKGRAAGRLSGEFNTTGKVLDLETGSYIQQHISMLEFIKQEIAEITGINKHREGDVAASDGLGTTQQAITQSAHITEPWFHLHDKTKLRVMECLLETAKYTLKTKGQLKAQHIMDDMAIQLYSIDTEDFCEAEYGLFVTNSTSDQELFQALKQLAHAGIQNDKISFSQLMDIYTTSSISSMKRKIEKAEQDKQEQQAQTSQAEQEHAEKMLQLQIEDKQADRELTKYRVDEDNATKITVAEISAFKFQEDLDTNNNGIPDPTEIARLALDERELSSNQFGKQMEINHKQQELLIKQKDSENKSKNERAKLDIEKEKLKAQKEIAKLKADTDRYKADKQLQVAKSNKNKYDK